MTKISENGPQTRATAVDKKRERTTRVLSGVVGETCRIFNSAQSSRSATMGSTVMARRAGA
jgi:hypothetical protein